MFSFPRTAASVFLLTFSLGLFGQNLLSAQVPPVQQPAEQKPSGLRLGLGANVTVSDQPAKPGGKRKTSAELDVVGGQPWIDTKLDLFPGDRVTVTATGNMQFMGQDCGPDGRPRAWMDLLRALPVNSAGRGALVGRVGTADIAEPFLLGASRDFQVRQSGRFFLGVNQLETESPTGTYKVKIKIVPAEGTSTADVSSTGGSFGSQELSTLFPPEFFQKLPRRVSDAQGNVGDMVNFLILGSEDQVRLAFQSAGWVKVDATTKGAVLHGLLSSISKQAYVEMPMSELMLFGRVQDYGFAHAEPLSVVATRHHLRIWKAPFEVDGQTLWVGAGTHDIGFERDQRNNGITHKIDPAVDGERDFIGQSLKSTGIVTKIGYMTPPDPLKEARTATGGSFHSDGRILVMMLANSGADRQTAFASVFCSVLRQEHPDDGNWGDCSQYVDATPDQSAASLAPIPNHYRILVLPGFMSSCVSSVEALAKGQEHLRKEHGLDIEYLSLPNDSSENNGKLIADYLKKHAGSDPRKYILIGYSKGAPDVQVGLAHDPEAAKNVAAFVSLAGAVGGSPVANTIPAMIDRYTKSLNMGNCQGDIAQAARSLRSDVRHTFLAEHPDPIVPTYSLSAVSDQSNTSKMLLQAWEILAAYDKQQDSQLTKMDSVVPGSTFLGMLKADHLAVALAFEDSPEAQIKSIMDHNHYPRVTLMESIVRFVIADLEKNPAK